MSDLISRHKVIKLIKWWFSLIQLNPDILIDEVISIPSAEPRWIPVSERLPESGEYCLVTRRFFGWNCTDYRDIDFVKYDFEGRNKSDTILAWMPLPEPYKEEQE